MKELLVGNAPCSWGTLEHQDQSQSIPFNQMLDELVETGYTGTELGDWGYMPTDPARLGEELAKREQRRDAGRVCAGGDEESGDAQRRARREQ
jgi:sugar phosphate isomerase/epimerase